jgi:hypothetical protein
MSLDDAQRPLLWGVAYRHDAERAGVFTVELAADLAAGRAVGTEAQGHAGQCNWLAGNIRTA